MQLRAMSLLLMACLLGACPGTASVSGVRDGGGEFAWYPLPDFGPSSADGGGGESIPTDTTPLVTPDATPGQPDLAVTTVPGGPCPCASPMECVKQKCRAPCVFQLCNGSGGCGGAEACIQTSSGAAACMPGVGLGKACSESVFCVGGLMCLTTDPTATTGTSYATCTSAGSACASGGTCSAMQGSTCLFCY